MEKKSLKDQIYEHMYEDILQGVYSPDTILNERILVEKYEVSKAPVREALVQLCGEGILRNLPRFGYQIIPISPQEIADILELRTLLELSALDKTIPSVTEAQLKLLEENVDKIKALVDEQNVLKHWFHNVSFHLLLCSFCGNSFIYEDLDRVLRYCSRGAYQYFHGTWDHSRSADGSNHRQLIGLIRDEDAKKAKKLLSEDIFSMKEQIYNS